MLCEELGLAVHQLRGMDFECFGDPRVQLLARAAQEAAMRGVLHQRMLEAVDRIWGRPSLEHQLGGDETDESCVQLVLRRSRDGTQQDVGKLTPYCGADLRH